MLDCKATRITAANDGFSERIFTDMGDKSDDEYQPPESFDTVMFWYDSEPNAAYSGHFYLSDLILTEEITDDKSYSMERICSRT